MQTDSDLVENYERASKKQKTTINILTSEIDNLIEYVESCKNQIQNEGKSIKDIGKDVITHIKNTHTKFQQAHKEFHSQLSKFGKTINEKFPPDQEKIIQDKVKLSEDIINQIIAEHFFREGNTDVGELFEKEAGVTVSNDFKEQFRELNAISQSLKRKEISRALEWCNCHIEKARNHDKVDEKEFRDLRMLAFQLHKLQYVELLVQNDSKKAIQYARDNLQSFSDQNIEEIKYLMGSILYSGRDKLLKSERYRPLLDESLWTEVLRLFKKIGCRRINQAMESPLYVSITAGYQAVPTLIKLASVTQGMDLRTSSEQLAIEIDLDDEFQYHSIFSCPVTKEQTTPENPPLLLPCNHVLAESSVKKILSTTRSAPKFKCPYCPSVSELVHCKVVHF
ncbi:predicted protein [Naegleria gruberi]|uniref:Predicted protein n=1 Tax=Naegleria gruberi TaxID=5762 RepID=D2VJJ0_NAEGR|nr:uncharacterized protein NAEGRDRAFT_69056 [Naegleria gruberi]EFC43047.1 predicted protein [Naegleria gruberi]|eukprot:XP_002675791.1 predicted protein [Naegleria gruberi strain NEG-M]